MSQQEWLCLYIQSHTTKTNTLTNLICSAHDSPHCVCIFPVETADITSLSTSEESCWSFSIPWLIVWHCDLHRLNVSRTKVQVAELSVYKVSSLIIITVSWHLKKLNWCCVTKCVHLSLVSIAFTSSTLTVVRCTGMYASQLLLETCGAYSSEEGI